MIADDLCNDVDACPEDADNDADNDGVCGDVDLCLGDDATRYRWRWYARCL